MSGIFTHKLNTKFIYMIYISIFLGAKNAYFLYIRRIP
ncbi:hypothetical protein GNIT_0120 [Glaciecola nitratireducens FR1064]|uniref:Uncharacterized protein n=1 Tax=Glaciecola nitratireducens (strain JCM 12485 / KCTC 12276 / FR1064) TaxID=1085623 RepID=G4QIT5_GLANF|nr:hypothetical protein GNIT_0120 [Glaciecola nitratireducens FR1064]